MKNKQPAFPVPANIDVPCGDHLGMTLRDYFAGQALAGFCANLHNSPHGFDAEIEAYRIADVMLEERVK